jgi:glycosyltransferase involved in cell wall biosynthesis
VSSIPEVAGDAALLVDPYNVDALADALRQLISDQELRAGLITKGFKQAAWFTWERSAQQLRTVYQQVVEGAI